MFRIGDFAALTRVSLRMLRHYDAIGLLKPDIVDPRTGYRFYSAAQLPQLNRLIALKELGFGLDDIGRLMGEGVSVDQMRQLLERRREDLRRRVEDDHQRLAEISARLSAIERDELHPFADVVVRKVPDVLMATIRATVPSFGKPIEALFDETEAYVARHQARSAASPLMVFHNDEHGREPIDIEVGVPVARAIPPSPRVSVREVEGAESMACLVYTGGYHQTERAVQTLRAWAAAIHWRIDGRVREVYVRFGADDADALRLPTRFLAEHEGEYVTEIQVPVIKGHP